MVKRKGRSVLKRIDQSKTFTLSLTLLYIILPSSFSISDPVPEVSPRVDGSSKGKFSLHRPDGTAIPSHPKVNKP